jgi:DNA polymerase III epsilon subunit-like protein
MNVRSEMKAWAREILADPRTAVLDTETTGLRGYVCEVAVLAADGQFLLDTLVNPGVPVEDGAYKVHGLGEEQLAGARGFGEVWPELEKIIGERKIVVYNAQFDAGVVRRELGRLQMPVPGLPWIDAMVPYSDWLNGEYDARYARLNGGHRAGEDCKAVFERLREMAE